MSATNSDNSEMKVIRVKPEEIQSYLDGIGCKNLTVSGTFCKVLDEREQNLDTYAGGSSDNGSDTGATDASTSSASGANKANIEFGDANIAFIMDLLQPDRLQELKLVDPTKKKRLLKRRLKTKEY